ncbi:hypothetical protein ACIBH1_36370 [Nonomuraea sp. NPDC050663]|uniref:hypothetical protein n=1 Tax=Nonomuraea sp. NPDC050663 TaxID=3364370 RepID=UPI0037B5A217
MAACGDQAALLGRLSPARGHTPPAVGSGDSLGSATADWSDCDSLDVGEALNLGSQAITGTHDTYYDYRVVLRVTGI